MKGLKKYFWVFEWLAAAILIAFAITSVASGNFVIYAFGCIFIIFGLFRLIPLIKTTESKLIKWLTVSEIVIDILAGAALFVWADKILESQNSLFGYIVGGILYLRGFMHFLSTSVKNEPTTIIPFVINIALITVATVIITRGGFSAKGLAWFFFAIALLCALLLIWRGVIDYRNYRGNLVGSSKMKKVKKGKEKEAETNPTSDEIKINIDNIDDEKKKDQPSINA